MAARAALPCTSRGAPAQALFERHDRFERCDRLALRVRLRVRRGVKRARHDFDDREVLRVSYARDSSTSACLGASVPTAPRMFAHGRGPLWSPRSSIRPLAARAGSNSLNAPSFRAILHLGSMPPPRILSLELVRTDGWFDRVGQTVSSFQALCDILGERFFAFSLITGARITALTVDRRHPENTLVDFTVGGNESSGDEDAERLPLADFQRRLVSALLLDANHGPPPPASRTRKRSNTSSAPNTCFSPRCMASVERASARR